MANTNRNDFRTFIEGFEFTNTHTFATQVAQWDQPIVVVEAGPATSREGAGARAAATRNAARNLITRGGKRYAEFNRTSTGALRVPRTFVRDQLHASPGDEVLVIGTKGIKAFYHIVKADGSVFIPAKILSKFDGSSFRVRADNGNLVVKA